MIMAVMMPSAAMTVEMVAVMVAVIPVTTGRAREDKNGKKQSQHGSLLEVTLPSWRW